MNGIIGPSAASVPTPAVRPEKRPVATEPGPGFGSILKDSIGEVNHLQHEADQAVQALAAGRSTDVHNTMIALQKADISFRLLMQIRNKVVSAYETVMRMQI